MSFTCGSSLWGCIYHLSLSVCLHIRQQDAPRIYHVCVAQESLRYGTNPPFPEHVTFSTVTTLPLPHHEYLALHALCCEVAWMSGALGYVMDIERRMDDAYVLANDA